MANFSIGEVEKLTGVKAHVLRYWETVLPTFRPQKDNKGRRVYTQRDVDFVFRIKYLVEEKKFTVEGAGSQIVSDLDVNTNNDAFSHISIIRSDLLNLYGLIQEQKTKKKKKKNDKK